MERLRDLVYYSADLDRTPRISREEEAFLLHRIRLAREGVIPVHLGTLAKRRLVEGNQRVVIFLAQKFRPSFTRVHLDDLIQEGNVALVEAVEQAYHIEEGFSTYAATAIRCALVNARVQDLPVSISHDTLYYLRQRNEVKKYLSWQTCSLSQPVEYDSSLTVGDAIVSVSAGEGQEDASEKVVWVEHLLSQLTPLQQQVLRLRYGLDPTDAHEHNTIEVAEKLGIGTSNVSNITKQALNTCRRLYGEDILALALRSQQTTPPPKKVSVSHAQQKRRRPPQLQNRFDSYERLQDAFARLREEGARINAKNLAVAAHIDHKVAKEFLRTHWDDEMEQEQALRDHESLEQASALLQARGEPITSRSLCRVTHVGVTLVGAFLRSKAGNEEERMCEAYARLQREGVTPIGRGRLARAAQVSRDRSAKFLRARQLQSSTRK